MSARILCADFAGAGDNYMPTAESFGLMVDNPNAMFLMHDNGNSPPNATADTQGQQVIAFGFLGTTLKGNVSLVIRGENGGTILTTKLTANVPLYAKYSESQTTAVRSGVLELGTDFAAGATIYTEISGNIKAADTVSPFCTWVAHDGNTFYGVYGLAQGLTSVNTDLISGAGRAQKMVFSGNGHTVITWKL